MLDDRPDNVVNEPFDDEYRNSRSEKSYKMVKVQGGYYDEDSKWIHRDKLVKIENEELQAAGIILPQPRSRSRPSRDRSQSSTKRLNQDNFTRSRKNSSHALEPKTPDTTDAINGNGWDWRGADEMDADPDAPIKSAGGSRIPVPKKSPLPIPTHNLERDKFMKRENSPDELERRADMPKARSRSNSTTLKSLEPSPHLKAQPAKRAATMDTSPKKPSPTGPRKTPTPSKTIPPEARGKVRPKGKNGSNGNTRPTTRSGDRELSSKPMEGDPPWMVSAYKPDPRLPPDQQLLPTVARRLQQEKWEQEGKFGNVYDKDFRPLTDEGFRSPPPNMSSNMPSEQDDDIVNHEVDDTVNREEEEEGQEVEDQEVEGQEVERPADDWPLKSPEQSKATQSAKRSSSYSTMPKIQDKPPMASPRAPTAPLNQTEPLQVTRVPDLPEKETGKKEKGGCGCCIVM